MVRYVYKGEKDMLNVCWNAFKVSMLLLFCTETANALSLDWDTFKSRFMSADGRILDNGNNNVSHTEGQGFSMLFAVAANDKIAFERIWTWTKPHLQDNKTGLFYWRYNPVVANPIEDKNNASDGDVMIAWALLKAGNRWKNNTYLKESDYIVRALLNHAVIDFANRKVMLPGRQGFQGQGTITLNPSYFIFPAWRDFAKRSYLQDVWTLIDDAQKIMEEISWGKNRIPTDWITLYQDGKTSPSDRWPARVSYDAIRVPLYIKWDNPDNTLLQRWVSWFNRFPRQNTPAWENVTTHSFANYPMSGGLLAVRDLTMGNLSPEATKILSSDNYYSASLKLLSVLASEGF